MNLQKSRSNGERVVQVLKWGGSTLQAAINLNGVVVKSVILYGA